MLEYTTVKEMSECVCVPPVPRPRLLLLLTPGSWLEPRTPTLSTSAELGSQIDHSTHLGSREGADLCTAT